MLPIRRILSARLCGRHQLILSRTVLLSDRHVLSWICDGRITRTNAARKGRASRRTFMLIFFSREMLGSQAQRVQRRLEARRIFVPGGRTGINRVCLQRRVRRGRCHSAGAAGAAGPTIPLLAAGLQPTAHCESHEVGVPVEEPESIRYVRNAGSEGVRRQSRTPTHQQVLGPRDQWVSSIPGVLRPVGPSA